MEQQETLLHCVTEGQILFPMDQGPTRSDFLSRQTQNLHFDMVKVFLSAACFYQTKPPPLFLRNGDFYAITWIAFRLG